MGQTSGLPVAVPLAPRGVEYFVRRQIYSLKMRIAASLIIGIDLGTTNCAVAFARPEDGPGASVED